MTAIPSWLRIARSKLGEKEIPGAKSNPFISECYKASGYPGWRVANDSDIAWCSAFINWVMVKDGRKGTGNLMARSWAKWGVPCQPKPGAVLVFPRGAPPSGHVTIINRMDANYYYCIGGNQSDASGGAVTESLYRRGTEIACRWPAGVKNSTSVQASAAGATSTMMGFVAQQAGELLPMAQEASAYIDWFQYVAFGIGLVCFGITSYRGWKRLQAGS